MMSVAAGAGCIRNPPVRELGVKGDRQERLLGGQLAEDPCLSETAVPPRPRLS